MKRPLETLSRLAVLTYSLVMFLASIFQVELPLLLTLFYLVFFPGYTIVETFSLARSNIEKLPASIGISLALVLGIYGIVQTMGIKDLLSVITIIPLLATLLSAAFLLRKTD